MGKSNKKPKMVGGNVHTDENVTMALNDSELDSVSGGETVVKETFVSNSIVVKDKKTGEVLYVLPY